MVPNLSTSQKRTLEKINLRSPEAPILDDSKHLLWALILTEISSRTLSRSLKQGVIRHGSWTGSIFLTWALVRHANSWDLLKLNLWECGHCSKNNPWKKEVEKCSFFLPTMKGSHLYKYELLMLFKNTMIYMLASSFKLKGNLQKRLKSRALVRKVWWYSDSNITVTWDFVRISGSLASPEIYCIRMLQLIDSYSTTSYINNEEEPAL